MKRILLACLLVVASSTLSSAAPAAGKIRTFLDRPGFPRESLRRGVSLKFYKSLTISPLEAWIVARAPLYESKASGAKIVRSDAGGAYDQVALTMANSMSFEGLNRTESRVSISSVEVHRMASLRKRMACRSFEVCGLPSDWSRLHTVSEERQVDVYDDERRR